MKYLFSLLLLTATNFSVQQIFAQNASESFLNCIASIDGIDSKLITVEQLANAKLLQVDSAGIEITSFKVSIYSKNASPVIMANNVNDIITAEMKKAFTFCKSGSKIYIEYIRCVDPNKISHTLSPIAIKIK